MVAQQVTPDPLKRMLEHLNIDIERAFRLMPEQMEDAMQKCLTCEMFLSCDDDVESRYFICANRDLLDRLEDLQDEK